MTFLQTLKPIIQMARFSKDNQPTHYRADHPRRIISVRVSEESYNKIKTKPKGWLGRWIDIKLKEE